MSSLELLLITIFDGQILHARVPRKPIMVHLLRQLVLCLLVAHWTSVVADVDKQTNGDPVKHGDSNTVVQHTTDLTSLSKLTTKSL